MSHSKVRWALLVLMALFLPLPYYAIFAVGLVSYVHLVLMSTASLPGLLLLHSPFLLGYGAALYVTAGRLATRLGRLEEQRQRRVLGTAAGVLFIAGWIPYFPVAAEEIYWVNAYGGGLF